MQDLRIELSPGATLTAGFLVDPGRMLEADELRVSPLEPPGTDPLARSLLAPSRPSIEGRGSGKLDATWSGLAAGTYTLTVQLRGATQPIAEIRDIELLPGRAATDPRLDPIDLRGR
jgi:hypothetical protein